MPQYSDELFSLLNPAASPELLFLYNGNLSPELMENIFDDVQAKLTERNTVRKKFYSILVEALQNVFHHQNHLLAGQPRIAVYDKGDKYWLITGNSISNNDVDRLADRISKLNNLTHDQIRQLYVDSLASTELSEKGGAGLGLIEMARRSSNKLEYQFKPLENNVSYFCLKITINKTNE